MNTEAREQIGRLIRRFAAKAATDDLLILIAEHSGLLAACHQLLNEANDPVTAAWLQSECAAAKTRPNLFLAEIENILTVIKPSQEHADLFALLELEPGAGREAIKRNYRRLSRRYHPDTGGSEDDKDTFIRITRAYQQLMASAETTETELPAPRRENSHWRRSLVPDTTQARRTQKRRNVVVVALLSLALIFVSLLAARTYNARVMMSGLKNKSLAFVPPTVGEQTAPATTPSAPTIAGAEAQPARTNPTTAAAPSPTAPDEHAAQAGRAAQTQHTPSIPTIASAEAQPARKDTLFAPPPAPAKASARTAEPEQRATTEPAPPATEPAVHLTPGNRKKTAPPATVAAHHQAAVPSEAPAAVAPAAQEKPTEPSAPAQHRPPHTALTAAAAPEQPTRQPAPAETSASAALAATPPASATGPQPLAVAANPTPAPVAARKTPVDEPAAKPTIAATQPPPAEHAANAGRTDSTPPAAATAQQPTTGHANKITASSAQPTPPANEQTTPTASTASTSRTTGTTTPKAKPEAATPAALAATIQAPTQAQPRERIDAFLHAYTAAYEQKNLSTFARFFAADATENGKTLNEVLSAYQDLFTTAETLRFTVSPNQYEHHQGQLLLRGRFTIAMTFKDADTKSGQGEITFRLTDTTPPQVQTLRYTFDQ